jgi:hypothetical protein
VGAGVNLLAIWRRRFWRFAFYRAEAASLFFDRVSERLAVKVYIAQQSPRTVEHIGSGRIVETRRADPVIVVFDEPWRDLRPDELAYPKSWE